MAERQSPRIGELGLRLALAFVGVALVAIVVLAGIAAATTVSDITRLVSQRERALTQALAVGAADAYGRAGWNRNELVPVLDVGRFADARVLLTDMGGTVIGSSPGYANLPREPSERDRVVVAGRQVGWVTVRFGRRGLGQAAQRFEAEIWRQRIIAAAIATFIALVVSVLVARWITTPVELMLQAMRARGSGNRVVRIRDVRGVGVLRELQEGFNKMTDALDERDRLQRNLVADVAHEVRTPVAILRAGHEAMLDGVSGLTRENVASMRDEVIRLANMVDDLQRLAAAESAALQLRQAPCDLATLAAEVAASLAASFGAAGLSLEKRLTEAPVLCDADRMREVIINLLTNALKFTPPGGRVVLETAPVLGDHLASVRVSDTGIGIPADELPHVTERFFRGRRSSGIAAGSGIGMTIVAELVRAHAGELDISSQEGIGTQVTVTLPMLDHKVGSGGHPA